MRKNILPFKFYTQIDIANTKNLLTELFFDEHIEEIRQRCFQSLFIIFSIILIAFIDIKPIVKILELPVQNVRFFQSSPGEYFISTLKIAFYAGIVFSIPIFLSQLIFFLLPGLTNREKKLIIGLIISSFFLFTLGLVFSYFVLIPAALKFFINYSSDVVEPLLSFDQYFSFILVLFFSTGVIFQVPVVQVMLSFSKIITGEKMLKGWKYVLLSSTIVGAVLTPSADPLTQLLLSGAVFFLYLLGSMISIFLTKSVSV
jgi:sec-independent protein translocase protein TatC